MDQFRKVGDACSFLAAGSFLSGLVLYATMLTDYTMGSSPEEAVAFLIDHRLSLSV